MVSDRRSGQTDSVAQAPSEFWSLRLYVAGRSPRAAIAFSNLKRVCEDHLAGHYAIDVVDLREQPAAAIADQVVAVPTVVRSTPLPPRRVVGDLSNADRVLRGLAIEPQAAA